MPAVFLAHALPGNGINILRKNGFKVDINDSSRILTKDRLKKIFSEYDGVITLVENKIDQEIINASRGQLKIISNYAAGFDNIDVVAAKNRGILVTNTPGVANQAVAEHTFALILACSKRLLLADRFVRLGKFRKWDPTLFLSGQIWGKTIGIVGLGKIGMFVGQIAYWGFRMNILYQDLSRSEDFELLTGAKYCELAALLKNSDIVTIHVPLWEKTKHLISKKELKMMKETAILINTSRGGVVDEESLAQALKEKEITAAGIDTFENEPHINLKLLSLDNVVLTPHIASATVEARCAMSRVAAENIVDVFEGRQPFGLISVK